MFQPPLVPDTLDVPSLKPSTYFWLAKAEEARTEEVKAALEDWLLDEWGFSAVAFPGRGIPWTEWR